MFGKNMMLYCLYIYGDRCIVIFSRGTVFTNYLILLSCYNTNTKMEMNAPFPCFYITLFSKRILNKNNTQGSYTSTKTNFRVPNHFLVFQTKDKWKIK